jgi:penicillin-binding protein 1C
VSAHARPPRWSLIAGLIAAALVAAGALAALAAVTVLGPLPASPESRLSQDATRYVDRAGNTLYTPAESGLHDRVPLEAISPALQAAVVATEDAGFYDHPGVNPIAIMSAAVRNLRAGRPVSGGGTITQQLVRHLYLTPSAECRVPSAECRRGSSRLGRKLREAVLALRLNRQMDKDAVLELYLNHAYFGNLAYGAESASRTYFGRPARDLDLAQSALLAGLIQAPAAYDPLRHPDAARSRQSEVLNLMVRAGATTQERAEAAATEPLAFSPTPFPIAAPHFVAWVREQVEAALGPRAAHGGLRVVTTLDLGVQRTAEDAVRRRLAMLKDQDVGNAAVVALDPASGQVLAMVGSADYFDRSIDGAVNLALAPRQPGSAMKPLLYALALENEITPATPFADVRTAFTTRAGELYVPNNYDGRFHGLIPAREALAGSYNVPAVKLLSQIGTGRFLALASAAGITTLGESDRFDLSLILGGGETPLLELTGAFAALANGGERPPVTAVLRVEDATGRVLWRPEPGRPVRVFSPQAAWLVTDILSDNEARAPSFGPNSPLRANRPAAAKTGTTSDFRDNWTVGYTPDLVVGVWVGNADNRSMRDVSGITGAAPIWHDIVEDALTGRPPRRFVRPVGLVQAEVCLPSGMKPAQYCARRRMEWFRSGTEPRADDTYYRVLPVCAATGLPATVGCTASVIVERVFEFPPPEVIPWAREHAVNLPPLPEYGARSASGTSGENGTQHSALGTQHPVTLVRPEPGLTLRISRSLPEAVQALTLEALVTGPPPDAVRIERNGTVLAVLRDGPYRIVWPLQPGVQRFRPVVIRDGVETAGDAVEVTVLNPLP